VFIGAREFGGKRLPQRASIMVSTTVPNIAQVNKKAVGD
jgi:hypothetical protein